MARLTDGFPGLHHTEHVVAYATAESGVGGSADGWDGDGPVVTEGRGDGDGDGDGGGIRTGGGEEASSGVAGAPWLMMRLLTVPPMA